MYFSFLHPTRPLLALLFYWILWSPLAAPAAPAPATPSLEFIQNKGQWDRRVRYEAALPAGRLFVQATGLTYLFVDPAALHHHDNTAAKTPAAATGKGAAAHAYTMHFEQGNAHTRLTAATPTADVRHYLVGNDQRRWASNVPGFRQLHYSAVWPGIDVQLYENKGQHLEYDFLLAPRANPARIALRYDGADRLTLDAVGNLTIKTSVTTVTELAPQAWQTTASGQRQPVACRYVLTGSTIRFALGEYDKSRALTIDPTVVFSSLTGSSADNWGFTATYDQQGNLYSGGIVFGMGYPASPGAYSTRAVGKWDMAIIKYNTQTNGAAARVWATYLGGDENDFPHSLVTNDLGEVVVLGSTSSRNFPTTGGALSRSFNGGRGLSPFGPESDVDLPNGADLVVARLSASGGALRASTYLGGSGNDGVQSPNFLILPHLRTSANYGDSFRGDVLLDGAGNVYVASNTDSPNFPGLSGGFGPSSRSDMDALVCKLPPALSAITWAGRLGGTGSDAAYSIQRDGQGRVYVCGGTNSSSLPGTDGAYRPNALGGLDGFAARISADGRLLERTTYVGTSAYDQAHFLQLDAAGDAYLFGQTLGTFPRTAGLYGTVDGSLFIQKLNADLTASIYSTAFGTKSLGGANLVPTAFLVDDCERVYISGWGGTINGSNYGGIGGSTLGLQTTPDAVQPASDGSDFYLAEFLPGLRGLDYATFFGMAGSNEHVDGGTSRFDKRGIVYQAVCASCRGGTQGFPVPPGANTYTTSNGSKNCNNAAFKIDFQSPVADPGPRRTLCFEAAPVALGGTPAGGTWSGPGVQPGPGGSGYQFAPGRAGVGPHLLTYTVNTTGVCQATLRVRYLVAPPVVPVLAPLPTLCTTEAALALTAIPGGGSFSGPGVSGGRFDPGAAGVGTHTLTYVKSDSLGCGQATRQVTVVAPPVVSAGRDTTLCADLIRPFQLQGYSPAGGTWSGPGVTASGYFSPPNTNNRGGIYTLTYTVVQPPCRATATRQVVLAPASAQNVGLNLPVCQTAPQYGGLAPFDCPLEPILPGGTYEWDFGDGSPTSTAATLVHRYQEPGTYYIRLTARYAGCEVLTQFAPLEVGRVFVPNIITPNGDSLNESFRPLFSCRKASLQIFSRWGQQVYQTSEYRHNWRGEGLADGLYYYLMRDADDRTLKGWVEIKRQR